MEYSMHIGAIGREGVDDSAGDVHHSFSNQPAYSNRLHILHERLKGHQTGEAHEHEARGFYIAMLAQP